MRAVLLILLLTSLPCRGAAQAPAGDTPAGWNFATYVDGYFPSGEEAYFVPTVFADRGALHLEARYNYEDFDTGSLFAGWVIGVGGTEEYLKLTPMAGVFLGSSNGVAPGLEIEARWRRLAYWFESEYTFNLDASEDDFFYTWSELNLYLAPFVWIGGSLQRLKPVDTPREVDFGPMVGFGNVGAPHVSLSLYGYGLGTASRGFLATVGVEF